MLTSEIMSAIVRAGIKRNEDENADRQALLGGRLRFVHRRDWHVIDFVFFRLKSTSVTTQSPLITSPLMGG